MNVTHIIHVDLTRRGNSPTIDVVQEEKYTRTIEIELREGFTLWYPPEDAVVLVRYQKADGTCGEYDTLPDGSKAYSISGNHVCVTLAPQMLTSEGGVDLCITLIWSNKELTICQGRLKVSGKLPEPEASEDYFNITGFIPQPETAAVGRYLEISEVDENGKIRAIRAVEAPTGNSELPENVVICDIEGAAEDETTVPLNADTLGGYTPDEYLRHSAITTTLRENLGTISGDVSMPLTIMHQTGNGFEMTDEGAIRCLKDGFVMATAAVMFSSAPSSIYVGIYIDNNDSNVAAYFSWIGGTYGCIGMPARLIPVKAGDILSTRVQGTNVQVNTNTRTGLTLMYV